MILVGVGEDQAVEKGPLLLDEAQVGQDDIDAGQPVVGEAEAEIDHQPAAVLAVEIGVDADLADAAERHEPQIGKLHAFCPFPDRIKSRLIAYISSRPAMVRSRSMCCSTGQRLANSGASPPVAITVIGLPYSAWMRPTRPSINPT